jgi:diaminopimelate epimerase
VIELRMQSVNKIIETPIGPALDTGSPHLVIEASHLIQFEVVREGRILRNSPLFMPGGINVNFYEEQAGRIFLRTYERGVEDETLSCGTGAIATALIVHQRKQAPLGITTETTVHCQGGELKVRFRQEGPAQFEDIWLIGPAEMTFEGTL